MSLVLSNKGKGMQSSSEQPLVGEERYVTNRITAAKETTLDNEAVKITHKQFVRPQAFWAVWTSRMPRILYEQLRSKMAAVIGLARGSKVC